MGFGRVQLIDAQPRHSGEATVRKLIDNEHEPNDGVVLTNARNSNIGGLAAFATGIVSFLSPCMLPLVPGYVSYVAGLARDAAPVGSPLIGGGIEPPFRARLYRLSIRRRYSI